MKANLQIKSKHSLDTLEQTRNLFHSKSHEKQYYKAIRKAKTMEKIYSILDAFPDNLQVHKKYWPTYHCNHVIIQEGRKFSSTYCKKIWCTNCCRIRTAELTNAYKQPLLDLGQLYFVTLTIPNVSGSNLKKTIVTMQKAFSKIVNSMQKKKYNIKLNGVRKIETTYNQESNTYHPHFHIIQADLDCAKTLQNLWLKQFPQATNKAQNITSINQDEQSFIELFKYATKETTKEGKQYAPSVLHTIYSAMEGKRLIQKFGTFKKIPTPKQMEISKDEFNHIPEQNEIWMDNKKMDYDTSDGQLLLNTLEIKNKIETQKLITLTTQLN